MTKAELDLGRFSNISFPRQVSRRITLGITSPFLKAEIIDENGSLAKAVELSKMGYAIIPISNHITNKDPSYLVKVLINHTKMSKRQVAGPIAFHASNSLIRGILRLSGINLFPIVTESTIEKGKNKGRKKNEGIEKYTTNAIPLMEKGGIVPLLIQGTRKTNLGEPDPNNLVVAKLMAAVRKSHRHIKYAFLVMGFEVEGVEDYSKKDGYNPTDKYHIKIGACLTGEKVLEEAGKMAEEYEGPSGKLKDPLRHVDKVLYEEIRPLLDPKLR